MYKSLVCGDEFVAHLKSHQRCSAAFCRPVYLIFLSNIVQYEINSKVVFVTCFEYAVVELKADCLCQA